MIDEKLLFAPRIPPYQKAKRGRESDSSIRERCLVFQDSREHSSNIDVSSQECAYSPSLLDANDFLSVLNSENRPFDGMRMRPEGWRI